MIIGFWVLAALLAIFYLYAGAVKIVRSQEELQPMMEWVGTLVPMSAVRAIGGVEVLGAIGLVVPALTGVAVDLAMWAALGLAVLQCLAFVVHLRSGGLRDTVMNVVLVAVALSTAWLATSL
ncbi:MAG: DoxX family protein [Aeromicrobium sp.]